MHTCRAAYTHTYTLLNHAHDLCIHAELHTHTYIRTLLNHVYACVQSYTVAEVAEDEIPTQSGTKIILTLREDAEEYLDDFKVCLHHMYV
jgi:hypothetical protein